MKTVTKEPGESLDELIRRFYTIWWTDGLEDQSRVERAMAAIFEANPDLEPQPMPEPRDVNLPELEGIPYLEAMIDETEKLHPVIHEVLERIQHDEHLVRLSFIDPIRLGCEALGIAVTPQVANEIHRRLDGVVSFNRERYEEMRDHGGPLHGIDAIRWVTGEAGR